MTQQEGAKLEEAQHREAPSEGAPGLALVESPELTTGTSRCAGMGGALLQLM
jgi:hypothetical protein